MTDLRYYYYLDDPYAKIANELRVGGNKLHGNWVSKKNSYERECCGVLGWEVHDNRYYDAYNGSSYIEIKKGQASMWFNMVRYAEVVLGIGTQDTITVHFRWSKEPLKVCEAYIIDTKRIIDFLKINRQKATEILEFNKHVPRQLCMQAAATNKDLKSLANRTVMF